MYYHNMIKFAGSIDRHVGEERERRKKEKESSRVCVYACLVANCFNRKPQFQSRGQIRRAKTRSIDRCDALRCLRSPSSSASKYRFRPYLMINIGNRTYLNLPREVSVSARCCLCIFGAAARVSVAEREKERETTQGSPHAHMRHFCCCCCCLNKF